MRTTSLLGVGDRILEIFVPKTTAKASHRVCRYEYRCVRSCSGGGRQRRRICTWYPEGDVAYFPWTDMGCGC